MKVGRSSPYLAGLPTSTEAVASLTPDDRSGITCPGMSAKCEACGKDYALRVSWASVARAYWSST